MKKRSAVERLLCVKASVHKKRLSVGKGFCAQVLCAQAPCRLLCASHEAFYWGVGALHDVALRHKVLADTDATGRLQSWIAWVAWVAP